MSTVPHLRIVVATCVAAVIGTWKSFAVAAFSFWLGSSSAGKMQAPPAPPSDRKGGPS